MRARWEWLGPWVVAVGSLGATACSGFGAGLPSDDFATDGPPDGGTIDDGVDETGADSEGPNGESGELGDPDCPLDCGEGGLCELDEDEQPSCACFEGYAAYGLRCLECTTTEGQVQVDIPRVMVGASFLLGGEEFPASIYEYGTLSLLDPRTGDEIELGQTRYGGTQDDIAVLPGPYEVIYSRDVGGDFVPANERARVGTVTIPDVDAHELMIDVPVVELSGALTLAGQTPPDSIYDNGLVVLRDAATGDEIELGQTRHGEYGRVVVPGTYEVHYRRIVAQGEQAPLNEDAIVMTAEIEPGDPLRTLDIDVPVTELSGTFGLDGAAPPASIYENGELRLHDPRTGADVVLGQTRDGSYAVSVVPGEYEVIYRRLLGGSEVPVNAAAVVETVEVAGDALAHDIEIQTAIVTGTITIDGATPPTDPSNDGRLVLRHRQTGDEAVLGNTGDGAYSRRVVRGTYDVHYRQATSSGGVPANTNARIATVDVKGGASVDIDVPMVMVSAAVTIDGQLPPDSAYDDGLLYLRNEQTGDSVLLGNTRLASLQRPVVPGTYDLVYVVEAPGPTVPVNAQARLSTVDVAATPELTIDIPVSSLAGTILVAGQAPPASIYDRAELFAQDVITQDVIPLGRIDLGTLTQSLTAGTYVLVYRALASTGAIPANEDAGLACFELVAP